MLGLALAPAALAASPDQPPPAAAAVVAPDRQVLVLVRALAYDGNLKARAGGEVTVGVLARGGHGDSEQMAEAISRALHALGATKVQGLPIRTIKLGYSTPAALAAAVRAEGVDALYVCPGLEADLPGILEVTRAAKVLSMAGSQEQLARGASVGVFPQEGKPTVFVNLPASRAEGAEFSSDLLRFAKVIK